MTFDVKEYREFVEAFYRHPEWRSELRRLVLTDDILSLPQVVRDLSFTVRELAEAQKRTEQRVEELAEAQKRTEQRVEELAEAQKRTEQRVEELAEAQKRTEQRVDRLASELGGLKTMLGASLEDEAGSVAETVFERKGFRILQAASSLRFDGDVDVAFPVEDPAGRRLWVLLETKARLGRDDVFAWVNRVRSEGYRQHLQEAGLQPPYLVYMYAIRVDLAAREALQRAGLGLMKGDGEIFPPQEEMM